MPLGLNIQKNIKELMADNKKKGKAKGASGKKRSMAQILAIAYSKGRSKWKKDFTTISTDARS